MNSSGFSLRRVREDMIENLSLMSDFLKGKKNKIKNLDSKRVVER